jgi:predicted lysophospholipase L1 biosynthesis ABC-type transport system permease subunit
VLIDGYGRDAQAQLAHMEKQTTRLMRDMGFNLMIVHRDTNMSDFWARDFSTVDMPQDYAHRLAKTRTLTLVTHLVATLQQKIEWNQRKVLLVGYLPEVTQTHRAKKAPMGYDIEPSTVYLGHELGVGHQVGDTVEVLGQRFRIAKILGEQGSKEDITIAMRLDDAQALLKKPQRVNQILALGCRCSGERLPQIRDQLMAALPDTKVTEFRSIAVGRAEQRDLIAGVKQEQMDKMTGFASVTTPLVVLACAVWVGLLAWTNVRERRTEIGLWRALGLGAVKIASLFLGKAVLLGLVGGTVGFFLGTWLAQLLGVYALQVGSDYFTPAYGVLVWTIVGAPVVCAMASYLPTLTAVLQDPAVVLSDA